MEYSNRSKRRVQILVGVGSSMAPFMVASMVVAAPTIGRGFQADVSLLGWIAAAFFLTAATFLLPFGRIADIRGSKRLFTLGLVIYLVSAGLSALAPNIFILILGRAFTGVGAAMVFGTSVALIGLLFLFWTRSSGSHGRAWILDSIYNIGDGRTPNADG